jgi:hypothetical protein
MMARHRDRTEGRSSHPHRAGGHQIAAGRSVSKALHRVQRCALMSSRRGAKIVVVYVEPNPEPLP